MKKTDDTLKEFYIKSKHDIQKIPGSWYRGKHCNFLPSKKFFSDDNFIKEYILNGFIPKQPLINKKDKIIAFGSCFAYHVSDFLSKKGYTVFNKKVSPGSHIIRYGEGMANSFTVLEQLEWIFENKKIEENTWHFTPDENAEINDKIRIDAFKILSQINLFVITLGLSEVWYNKITEQVYWKAIPANKFNDNIHGFKLSTVEENTNNINKIYKIINKHCPSAKLVFTLSPIPLIATFRAQSCITANSVSKSILRISIDNILTKYKNKDNIFYYPSYEITKDFFIDPYHEDNRHLKPNYTKILMEYFEKYFCN